MSIKLSERQIKEAEILHKKEVERSWDLAEGKEDSPVEFSPEEKDLLINYRKFIFQKRFEKEGWENLDGLWGVEGLDE